MGTQTLHCLDPGVHVGSTVSVLFSARRLTLGAVC